MKIKIKRSIASTAAAVMILSSFTGCGLFENHGKTGYIIEDGAAQPILQYSNYLEYGYSNKDSDILRFCVYVETDNDTDNDGKADLVKVFAQVPKAAVKGDYKAAVIYDPTPYGTGTVENFDFRLEDYSDKSYNYDDLYRECSKRTPNGEQSTYDLAMTEDSSDWNYVIPATGRQGYDYGQMYDYYLVRGFAVVESGGIGTYGSEGYELCGFDLERDAHKCVVEWLTGDRKAYADKDGENEVKADWSSGKVAMTGCSYGGTLPYEVATTGVKGLETIIPFAGIASWYDYTNSQGVTKQVEGRYADTLASYNCGGLFLDDYWTVVNRDYASWLSQIAKDQNDANGNYTDIWERSNYADDYENINCSALIVHGVNDYNVTAKQSDYMYQAFKKADKTAKLVLHQDGHNILDGLMVGDKVWQTVMNEWLCHYLLDVDNGAENMAEVTYQDSADGLFHTADKWRDFDYKKVSAKYDKDTKTVTTEGLREVIDAHIASTYGSRDESVMSDYYISLPESHAAVYELDVKEGETILGVPTVSFEASPTIDDYTGLMTTAVLVDTIDGEQDFASYVTKDVLGDILPFKTVDSFDVGGGYGFLPIREFVKSYTTSNVVSYGWMDLANPGCGSDIKDYVYDTRLKAGEDYSYTFYMMPTTYTLEKGHKLMLVLTTYDPYSAPLDYHEEFVDYGFTVNNKTLDVEIPILAK